ncbi:MAG TPA: hypothetical protein VHA33_05650, partial [Candidatus Angelobacter sp.]|nr:hypothetical protein [Candidatus Angelobacter sp.]
SQTGNLKLAQRMLGHSRFETTANVYTHALEEQEREAAVAVEQAIFGEFVPISVLKWEQQGFSSNQLVNGSDQVGK